MRATLIESWAGLGQLADEWNALLSRSRSNTPFLTWEWVQAWLVATDGRHEPLVVVVRDGRGQLCGIAPFYVVRYRLGSCLSFRVLRIVADASTGAEYPDWIVDRDAAGQVEPLIVATLRAAARRWDMLWVPNLAAWSGAEHDLSAAFRADGCHVKRRPVEFLTIGLPRSLDAFEAQLSANRRQQLRRRCRKLLALGDVRISRCETARELPAYLDALFDLHRRRWRMRGDPGSFQRRPELARFYRHFAPTAARMGWLRLYALRQGNAFRAVQLGYVYDKVFYQIQEGFDPEFTAGAGNVLRHKVIEACIAEGVESYDFMAGDSEHKRRWGATPRTGCDLFIGRPGLLTRPLLVAGVWPTGRYLRPVPADTRSSAGARIEDAGGVGSGAGSPVRAETWSHATGRDQRGSPIGSVRDGVRTQ